MWDAVKQATFTMTKMTEKELAVGFRSCDFCGDPCDTDHPAVTLRIARICAMELHPTCLDTMAIIAHQEVNP